MDSFSGIKRAQSAVTHKMIAVVLTLIVCQVLVIQASIPSSGLVKGVFDGEEVGLRVLHRMPEPACDMIEIRHAPAFKGSLLHQPLFKVVVVTTGDSEGKFKRLYLYTDGILFIYNAGWCIRQI